MEDVEAAIAKTALIIAGPTLQREIDEAKALDRAADQHRFRKEMSALILTQRSGVLRLLKAEAEESDLLFPDSRVHLHLDIMLEQSANVAAFTGSPWASTLGWLRKHLPDTVETVGEDALHGAFLAHLDRAKAELASRAIVRLWDLQVGRSAQDIAHELGTTTAQLQAAKANSCRLTSVDAMPKKVRDCEAKRVRRRAAGMRPQSECRTRERDCELAALADVTDRWIRKLRLNGKLADFLASKGIDAPEAESSQKCRQGKGEASSQKWRAHKEIMSRQIWELPVPTADGRAIQPATDATAIAGGYASQGRSRRFVPRSILVRPVHLTIEVEHHGSPSAHPMAGQTSADRLSADLRVNLDAMARLRSIPDTPAAIEGARKVADWHAYLDGTRASTVYGRQPLPTPKQHTATTAALHAGADAAWAEFGMVSGF